MRCCQFASVVIDRDSIREHIWSLLHFYNAYFQYVPPEYKAQSPEQNILFKHPFLTGFANVYHGQVLYKIKQTIWPLYQYDMDGTELNTRIEEQH